MPEAVMSEPSRTRRRTQHVLASVALASLAAIGACGGGNPLDNPATVGNPAGVSGQRLSFAYFQKCINPIFLAAIPSPTVPGSTNTCAGSGCHDNTSGTGGALRVVPGAAALDVTNAANTPDVIRASDMYKNFYSAQGAVIIGSTTQSRLLAKPLLLNVLHGGGLIFANDQDPNVKLIQFWINHPGPDEFSTAAFGTLFTPADPNTGICNTQ
jgi:hypothetical protein